VVSLRRVLMGAVYCLLSRLLLLFSSFIVSIWTLSCQFWQSGVLDDLRHVNGFTVKTMKFIHSADHRKSIKDTISQVNSLSSHHSKLHKQQAQHTRHGFLRQHCSSYLRSHQPRRWHRWQHRLLRRLPERWPGRCPLQPG